MTEARDEWVRLSTATARQRISVAGVVGLPAFAFSYYALAVGKWIFTPRSVIEVILVGIGSLIVMFAISIGLYFLLRPAPMANFAARKLRVRRTTIPFAEIDSALVEVLSPYRVKKPIVALRFGKAKGLRASVVIADSGRPTLDAITRERLADVFRQSNIRMPTSSYDPTGAFARYNFPGHLDREEAIDFALHPPKPGQPMPWTKGLERPEA